MTTPVEKYNILDLLGEDKATKNEVAQTFATFTKVLQTLKENIDQKLAELGKSNLVIQRELLKKMSLTEGKSQSVSNQLRDLSQSWDKLYNELSFEVEQLKVPQLPPLVDLSGITDQLSAAMTEIANLKSEIERLKTAPASIPKTERVVATNRSLYQLLDMNLAGVTTNQSIKWNGTQWVPFTPSGSGATIETPTGAVNSSNQTFTVSAEPQYVIADGVTYFDGAGYTYAALSITMDTAPSQYIRAFI